MFMDRCQVCGWMASGTCSPTIDDLRRSTATRLIIRWKHPKMTSDALKVLRGLSRAAKAIPLVELSKMMVSGQSFELGVVIEYKLAGTVRELLDAGYMVIQEPRP